MGARLELPEGPVTVMFELIQSGLEDYKRLGLPVHAGLAQELLRVHA